MTTGELAATLEATLLRPDVRAEDVRRLCAEARQWGVGGVCVPPTRVALACHCLEDSEVKVGTVAGFPLGIEDSDTKRMAVEAAVDSGAQELDVVMNIGRFKDGEHAVVLREMRDLVEAAEERPVKVILEVSLLSREEIIQACHLVLDSGASYVKSSTGFGVPGVSVADVRLLRETVGPKFGVKAAGGIRDLETARAMLDAGADRLGTSSAFSILRAAGQAPPAL